MQQVIVIGGGVVGLTTAWWLAEAGYGVTLLERSEQLAMAASYRNGGQLSYRYVAPLADAGVPLKALQWLMQKDGPLRFRPEADWRQWRWLGQFLRNCNSASNRRTTATLLQLGELSRLGMAQLALSITPQEFAWRNAGKLVVYRSKKIFKRAVARPASEPARQVLSPAEAAQQEPALAALAPSLAGAIFTPGEAVADCHAFCQALEQRLLLHPRFQRSLKGEARGFLIRHGRVTAVDSDLGPLQADHFVLAAGIQSRDLAAQAGIYLPLYPLKGYSLTAPIRRQHRAPEISITDFERKVLYARIGADLRVAAMVDLVGADASLDRDRIASLSRLAQQAMPGAADYDNAIPWAGLRPATPNSAPLVGASKYGNLWLNVGHGPLGFTFACGSASILADLMRGRHPPFALDFLQPG
ncbi:D-amino acid dehydrogenase [Janthinobacterium agaricidamnosum]|uniref:FAD dependent oxidoreductase family protein n=1 Tax=Janthinobacterium agaricidamnosum NBRC 102515 = DSM 9628 TaxID=1349767 RepID=W0UWJ2_9BURK|nr:D-amino acid dehydrogenase [Janthinobacterium agaricidamnosum]CDG80689.1 FAD dependent oxidoreductase family protein [Janthinobacterium agaricidamnosum NBRC 102515 = DSM 9628]